LVPPEPASLLDKQAIHEVMMRYCRGVDRQDAELLRSTYWPDAWDDHGLFSGLRDDFVAWVIPFLRDSFSTVIHTIGNELVELDGDIAFSESYFSGYYELVHEGRPHTRMSCGRYIDRFERREGEWRIARRTVVNDWGRLDPLDITTPRSIPGGRYPLDPVYTLRESYFAR
jgi:ketosteroid isomerase-like protein